MANAQPNTLSMYNFMVDMVRKEAQRTVVSVAQQRVMETYEYCVLADTLQRECEGDRICKTMEECWAFFGENGYPPSPQQRVMLKGWLTISYAQLYGDDLQQHMPRLLKDNGQSELRSEMAVFMARRGGKTVMANFGTSSELVSIPWPHDILVYSNNSRASVMMLLGSYKFTKMLSKDSRFGGKVSALNKSEHMQFQTRFGNLNEMFAYPAKPETLRGTGSKNKTGTVVAEEFAYMKLEIFYEIIGPTLTRDMVKFVGITTTSGSDSFVSPLTEARFPDGRAVLLTLNFELVCEDCKKAGIPEKCKCLMADIPHWQSVAQHNKLEIIMKDHLQTYLREIRGMTIDQSVSLAFDPAAVKRLNEESYVMMQRNIFAREIFVAVDPACGGDMSKFAIVSAIYVENFMIVSAAGLSFIVVVVVVVRCQYISCIGRCFARGDGEEDVAVADKNAGGSAIPSAAMPSMSAM